MWARFLFQDRGILPTRRLLVVFLIFSCAMILLTFVGLSWAWIFIIDGLFFLASLLDLFFSPRKNQLAFKRTLPEELERGQVYTATIEIDNTAVYPCAFRLIDRLPQSFEVSFPLRASVNPQANSRLSYEITAPLRGKYEVNKLDVRYRSRFGLWEKQTTADSAATVKVTPDLTETKQYLQDAQQFLREEGLKIRRQKSGEGEFSKIRSYVVGDDPRKINWRQTAKLQEVMTNVDEPEHGKSITLLIDCGRMMGAELKVGNRLERVLEAAMTVSAAALQSGDYVSVVAFSKQVKRFVPADKGMDHLQKILYAIYDLEVDAAESNYAAVFNYVQTVQKKRSLLLLFSDVHTFLHEESGLLYLQRLRRRHLFLMIGLEDEALASMAKLEPDHINQTMVKSIAQQQIQSKEHRKADWEKQGLAMVEAREEQLATTAVSHYIEIMNQGLL